MIWVHSSIPKTNREEVRRKRVCLVGVAEVVIEALIEKRNEGSPNNTSGSQIRITGDWVKCSQKTQMWVKILGLLGLTVESQMMLTPNPIPMAYVENLYCSEN